MRQVTKIMNYLDYGIWAREFIGLSEKTSYIIRKPTVSRLFSTTGLSGF